MSFPGYERYKDSGDDWLREVPAHWKIAPLKTVATHNDEVLDENVPPDAEIMYVDISSVDGINGITSKEAMLFAEAPSRARRRVRDGDVIVSTVRTYLRAIACIREPEENLIVSTGFAVIRSRSELVPKFLGHVLTASYFVEQVIARSTGVSYPAINASDLVAIPIVIPPLPEQSLIAGFLDRETAKIDALVGEQRRLIELLKEKRQAVISHAVTKGLNPHAALKPSGIEWLGDVPAHWEIKRLRHFADVLRGKFTHRPRNDPAYYDGEFPFVQTGDITGTSRYITGFKQTLNERGIAVSKLFPKGTLVMAIAANIGDVAILDFPAYFPDSIVGLLPKHNNDLMFMYYLMIGMKQPMLMTATVSTQMNLNVDQICSLTAACPPLKEQAVIVGHLDNELQRMEVLTAEAERAIDLLQERRTALISAAVTGKIDVRGLTELEAA